MGKLITIQIQSSRDSTWWKNVIGVGREEAADCFKNNVSCIVGDGKNIGFWKLKWFGNQSFNVLFLLLFAKESQPNILLADCFWKIYRGLS
jgi:hypothetical protein